jgi:hypothetical protein
MASGKQTGEYSFKFTSITNTPGPGASVLVQGNFEGPVTAPGGAARSATVFGTNLGTVTFVGGGKSGTYSVCSQGYLDNGEVVRISGSGSYESVGKHRWRTRDFMETSTGQSRTTEGEIDLAARSWTGKVFEKV